jgi:hypothetical protein
VPSIALASAIAFELHCHVADVEIALERELHVGRHAIAICVYGYHLMRGERELSQQDESTV